MSGRRYGGADGPVVYQVYPRSFQDSDGDGIGDLGGVIARLDHIASLGCDALWLSPMYPSPLADFGYDVADFTGVDPTLGTLADVDRLVAEAHARGLLVLFDLVPSHTSIEHPWFRQHPDWYIWSDDGPPNNWIATFGGPAWTRDDQTGRWYLHSFYPEQPDLDWRNPEVVAAMQDVVRTWRARGIDGFRVDAVDRMVKDARLRDDPPREGLTVLPFTGEYGTLRHRWSRDQPEIREKLAALRTAAGDDALMIGEVYLPNPRLANYLDAFDYVFAFEFFFAEFAAPRLRSIIEATAAHGHAAWMLSNHDFPRLTNRLGPGRERVAALLTMTLPGAAFVYQGDEIGLVNGPGHEPPYDRAGRDPMRHPMQWDGSPGGGFTPDGGAAPWLAPVDPAERNVAAAEADRSSLLWFYRDLIAARREITGDLTLLESADEVLCYRRGDHIVAVNLAEHDAPLPPLARGPAVLATIPDAVAAGRLAPLAGVVVLRTD